MWDSQQSLLQYEPLDGKSSDAVENFLFHTDLPKLRQPVELNDYRPVALTSHIMKTFDLVRRMTLQVAEDLDALQFAYQKHIGVKDTIL